MIRFKCLVVGGLALMARALEVACARAAAAPKGVARGGAPLIFGLAVCLLAQGAKQAAAAAIDAAAPGGTVRGEVLTVSADGGGLILSTADGALVDIRLSDSSVVTLNGRTVTPRALRPVTSDSLAEATVTLDAAGRAIQVEGRYELREGIVLGFSEDGSTIYVRTVDEWGREDSKEFALAKGLKVKAGAEVATLGRVQPGTQVLILLDWAGRAKKIELPPPGEKVFSGTTRII